MDLPYQVGSRGSLMGLHLALASSHPPYLELASCICPCEDLASGLSSDLASGLASDLASDLACPGVVGIRQVQGSAASSGDHLAGRGLPECFLVPAWRLGETATAGGTEESRSLVVTETEESSDPSGCRERNSEETFQTADWDL